MIFSDDAACCPVLRDRARNGLGHVSERTDSKGKTRMPLSLQHENVVLTAT